jgi:hypothetical protein
MVDEHLERNTNNTMLLSSDSAGLEQLTVTSHALTARGSNDSELVLIEKYLEGAMFKF